MANEYIKLKDMLEACYPVVYLTTYEYKRTNDKIYSVIKALRDQNEIVNQYVWNCVDGLCRLDDNNTDFKHITQKVEGYNGVQDEDVVSSSDALNYIRKLIKSKEDNKTEERDVFIFEDLNNDIELPDIIFYLRKISERGRYTNTHVIIVSASYRLPIELEKYIAVLNISLPDEQDLDLTLSKIEKIFNQNTLSIKDRHEIINAALGMTTQEADLAFLLAAVKSGLGKDSVSIVSSEKEQIIRKSGILEYFSTNGNLEDVGGLHLLKDWLNRRHLAYDKSARDWGLREPKGLLLVGVPGCGKSLTAKCIASTWKMPLLRLDLGKVFRFFCNLVEKVVS